MFLAGDGSGIGVRAALLFRGAGLAGQFQGAVFGPTLTGRPSVRIGMLPAELLQGLALGADVLVVLGVPLEVRPAPGAIAAPGLASRGPLAGRVGMRRELGLHFAGGAECGLIQRIEILTNRAGRIGWIDP